MRILLVEDEKILSQTVSDLLKKNGYSVDAAFDGEDGLYLGRTNAYDLVILDVLMPGMDGIQVLKSLRKNGIKTPVLMLTALSTEQDKVNGLDCGADDYLPKPFSVPELLARIRALLRRRGELVCDDCLRYGDAWLNLFNYTLGCEQRSVKLSAKEFELARYFFERPNFVAVKESIIDKVWGLDCQFESNNLEAYVSFLRKKFRFIGSDVSLRSVRGVGYRLSTDSDE